VSDQNSDEKTLDPWVKRANQAFEASTTYVDNNYRKRWQANIRMHQSLHPAGSKYLSESYQYKSRLFRPKTRAMTRQNEAAAAAAFFSNVDAVSIEPFEKKSDVQKASAELRDGLLNHRLQFTIPWFLNCVGGMQDAQVQGVVASKQYWKIKKHTETVTDENGEEREITVVDEDKPCMDLKPIEYVRISPSANWVDPINSSPYVILMEPMYIGDVKAKIEAGEWEPVEDKDWAGAVFNDYDATRNARENERTDSQETQHTGELTDFDMVMVHENFIRYRGKEIHYYTLGTVARLSKPVPLREAYWHNMRPIALGSSIIETHNNMPPGTVELGANLQREINEIVNTRQDNVKLVLNKRYIVKRGQQVDLRSLVRNAAGSITLANNPESDVNPIEFQDVTASAYAEQDRLNVDYDELTGNFSSSSVQSNRKLNETVGGMQMLRSESGGMTQYLISVFSETWVEKVLRQLDALEQHYETDLNLLMMIANERDIFQRFNIPSLTPTLLRHPAKVIVNVVNSATDPILKLEQFLQAVQRYTEIVASAPPNMDLTEVRKEIFGKLGYKDGNRFFVEEDGNQAAVINEMQQTIQQLSQAIEDQAAKAEAEQQGKMMIANLQETSKRSIEEMKQTAEDRRHEQELRFRMRESEEKHAAELQKARLDGITELTSKKMETTSAEKQTKDTADATVKAGQESEKSESKETEGASVINLMIDNTSGKVVKNIDLKKTKDGYQAKVLEEPIEETVSKK